MFDLIIGANGQDGKLLSEIYARNDKKVILIGRSLPEKINTNQHFITLDLREYRDFKTVIKNYKIRTVIYLAACHTTRDKFNELNPENVRLINYEAPKWLLNNLVQNNNITSFVYASSKLVFEPDDGVYSWRSKRRYDNEYSKSKNEFESYANTISSHLNWLLIVWLSNHESKYRQNDYLIPRVINKIKAQLNMEKTEVFDKYNIINDWGDAEEFMEILYEFVQTNKKEGLLKQFLSNNDLCSIDEIIDEILIHKENYGNFLKSQPNIITSNAYISEYEFLRRPKTTTRSIIWRLLSERQN